MNMKRRVAELEARSIAGAKRWHVIRRWSDQTEDDAVAAYEANSGPIGPDDGSILRVIIRKPVPAPGST